MTNYNDGKWHGWNGGECPVHPETLVEVRLKDRGAEDGDMTEPAMAWFWPVTQDGSDIVAFRVIKEHREPREWWIGYGSRTAVYTSEDECAAAGFEPIHVREVLE